MIVGNALQGRIAAETKLSHIREIAVREIVARTAKTLVRDAMSCALDNEQDPRVCIFLHHVALAMEGGIDTKWRNCRRLL